MHDNKKHHRTLDQNGSSECRISELISNGKRQHAENWERKGNQWCGHFTSISSLQNIYENWMSIIKETGKSVRKLNIEYASRKQEYILWESLGYGESRKSNITINGPIKLNFMCWSTCGVS